ncbi:MAG: endopeptidase La [Myxococcota bacterium]|jgi:ATP-dependent Lon protease|nr:endopeptidase La [Myxococcota bacterium]
MHRDDESDLRDEMLAPEPELESEQDPMDPEVISQALVALREQPPQVLPTVLLDDLVPFPGLIVPILLDDHARRDAILNAKSNHGFFLGINRCEPLEQGDIRAAMEILKAKPNMGAFAAGFLNMDEEEEDAEASEPESVPANDSLEDAVSDTDDFELTLADLASVGTLGKVIKMFRMPDDRNAALVQFERRARPEEILRIEPFPAFKVHYPLDVVDSVKSKEFEALSRQVRSHLRSFLDKHPHVPEEIKVAAMGLNVPGLLADFVAQHLSRDFEERLSFLCEVELGKRMQKALEVTLRELDFVVVGNKISDEIRDKIESHQREYFLREQLKSIRRELGEEKDPGVLALEELKKKIEDVNLPEHAKERAEEELKRLEILPVESPEHNVIRSYLEWIGGLPWGKVKEESANIVHARDVLDEDHYGLDEIKDRIVEFLAVRQLNPAHKGSIMCFAGPPGVGKTSLGQSIARALGRDFFRLSVGGMRDEAEIKGHRRTYVGAMPGRIIQGLKQAKSANPVFMLDEIDKMGKDWRGDPSSAMLEVLDPAQNTGFLDHYLDLTFDLSKVMFIATANVQSEIPGPLRDRMEIIDLAGYIPEEKEEIAQRYLFPRQRKSNGLLAREIKLGRPALRRIICEYTYEAGVRNLERQIAKVCRKRATQKVQGKKKTGNIPAKALVEYLGPPKIHDDRIKQKPKPGLALGLAWTSAGGEVLFIEAAKMHGKGGVRVTGHLGEVMQESTKLAVSYVQSACNRLAVERKVFAENDFHIHFPAGAVRKDGPSAGITITTALISLLTGKPVKPFLAMTGEMTLRGDVLPVGGIREKVVAARRAGIRTIILPEKNKADVDLIPDYVQKNINFLFASTYQDVLGWAFPQRKKRKK